MQRFFVSLSSINDVKLFTNAASQCSGSEIDVLAGRYVIDAKSIMGLFSLDLAKPVKVEFHGPDADAAAFRQEISGLLTDSPE